MWLGEVNLRKSVAVISITDLHVMVTCCISLTLIFITRPKFDSLLPALELSLSVPFVLILQAFSERGVLVRLYSDGLGLGI